MDAVSGGTTLDTVRYLAQYWRWAPSHGFHTVAEHLVSEAKSYGLQDAHIERFIADKKTRYLGLTMYRPSWDPISADVWVVSPTRERITRFADIPMCLAGYSRNTDVTAEVVDVGSGTSAADYAGKDVRGKIVLGTGAVGALQQMAVFDRGALGVLSAWTPEFEASRDPLDYPDEVTWGTGPVPESATGQPSTFGIMLSLRQREMLENQLRSGLEVMVHVTVQADFEDPGYLEVATATIPGREYPNQEIVFSAHLDHPKPAANDNDSGSATILEVARILEALIRSGQLPPPKRTIRFLWVEEGRSTRSYLAEHRELRSDVIADINMDIVGSDTRKTRAILYYWRSADSHPTFMSDVVEDYFDLVRNIDDERMPLDPIHPIFSPTGSRQPFIATVERYARPSDQSFFISDGIPGLNFAAWPDQFHHTQLDTPDKTDPTLLERVAVIAAASAATAADAGPQDTLPMVIDMAGRAHVRLGEDLLKAFRLLQQASAGQLDDGYKEATNIVREGYLRERGNLESIRVLIGQDKGALNDLARQEAALAASEPDSLKELEQDYELRAGHLPRPPSPPQGAELAAEQSVPAWVDRMDPESLFQRLGSKRADRLRIMNYTSQKQQPFVPDFNVTLFETLSFIDGRRSVKEIRDAVSAEYAPVPLDAVTELMKAMEEAKLIEIRTAQP